MKRFLTILFCIVLACQVKAANVTVNVRDISSGIVYNRMVTVTLTSPTGAAVAGPWLIAGDSVTLRTDTNGACTFSNLLTLGQYRLDVSGNPSRSFPFTASNTNGTYNVISLFGTNVQPQLFYNSSQIDALFGTGVNALTNGDTRNFGIVGQPIFTNGFSVGINENGAIMFTAGNLSQYPLQGSSSPAGGLDLTGDFHVDGNVFINDYTFSLSGGGSKLGNGFLYLTNGSGRIGALGAFSGPNKSGLTLYGTNSTSGNNITSLLDIYDTNADFSTYITTTKGFIGPHLGNGYGLTNLPYSAISNAPTIGTIAASNSGAYVLSSNGLATNLVMKSGAATNSLSVTNSQSTNMIEEVIMDGDFTFQISSAPGLADYLKFISGKTHSGGISLNGSEPQLTVSGNLALQVGFQRGVIRHFQFGIGNGNQADSSVFTSNTWAYWQGCAPFGTTPGYSGAETYKAVMKDGSVFYPGIMSLTDPLGTYYELHLLRDLVATANPTADTWDVNGIKDSLVAYSYPTNAAAKRGIKLLGGLIQEKVSVSSGSSYAFDFGAAFLTDITATSSAITFSTLVAGESVASTNYERRVFLIRSGGNVTVSFTWPAYQVLGTSAGGSLPSSISSGQLLRLQLEQVGVGDTNILASYSISTDSTFVYDSDALAFLGRISTVSANITNSINKFVVDMKGTATTTDGNAWGKFTNGFIYPFVGGDATSHSKNLVSTSYTITWNNTPTQSARGVTGNGSSMYGQTGFTPSTAAGGNPPTLNSMSVWVYAATNNSPANPSFVIGGVGGSSRVGLGYALVGVPQWNDFAINDNASQEVARLITTDGRDAGVVLQRTASNAKTIITTTSGPSTVSTASVALPNAEVYILARNNGGPANYYSGTVKFLACGKSMTTAEAQTVLGLIETLQVSLGRNGLVN